MQVNLFPRIYRTATEVIVWLGPTYNDSRRAMDTITCLSRSRRVKSLISIWARPVAAAIRNICFRAYWTRLWVFQELVLAPRITLLCGSDSLSWDWFTELMLNAKSGILSQHARERFEYQCIQRSPAMSMVQQVAEYHSRSTLWDLMDATMHLNCFERRDRVYALLGIAKAGHLDIKADYGTPIPALLNAVLKNYHLIRPPSSLADVSRDCEHIARLLQCVPDAIFHLEGHSRTASDSTMTKFPLSNESGISLWWAAYYRHERVRHLLLEEGVVNPLRDIKT